MAASSSSVPAVKPLVNARRRYRAGGQEDSGGGGSAAGEEDPGPLSRRREEDVDDLERLKRWQRFCNGNEALLLPPDWENVEEALQPWWEQQERWRALCAAMEDVVEEGTKNDVTGTRNGRQKIRFFIPALHALSFALAKRFLPASPKSCEGVAGAEWEGGEGAAAEVWERLKCVGHMNKEDKWNGKFQEAVPRWLLQGEPAASERDMTPPGFLSKPEGETARNKWETARACFMTWYDFVGPANLSLCAALERAKELFSFQTEPEVDGEPEQPGEGGGGSASKAEDESLRVRERRKIAAMALMLRSGVDTWDGVLLVAHHLLRPDSAEVWDVVGSAFGGAFAAVVSKMLPHVIDQERVSDDILQDGFSCYYKVVGHSGKDPETLVARKEAEKVLQRHLPDHDEFLPADLTFVADLPPS